MKQIYDEIKKINDELDDVRTRLAVIEEKVKWQSKISYIILGSLLAILVKLLII
jgi:hypothetical protein